MPVRFGEPSETGGVIVKEILVSDDDRQTNGSRRDKLAIKIRILPRKKRRPKVGDNWSKIDLVHCQHPQQQRDRRPKAAKRTRFSCWSAAEDDSQHLQHCDVADDVTYWSSAATTSCPSYSSCAFDDSQPRGWNVDEDRDSDDQRRRRSYRTAQHSASGCQRDVPTAAGDDDSDEVFEDVIERGGDWRDAGHQREALRSMNAGSAANKRRQRVSQPPRRRPGGTHAGPASNADAQQGRTERKPGPLRRAVTDLDAAVAAVAGHRPVYFAGDVDAVESMRRRSGDKKTADSGCTPHADDWKKTYDDDEGYYRHVPHDNIAYR